MFHYQASDPLMEIEKQWKPIIEIAPNCPRCASPNTKFCYYNNYSLSQPRYFCKGCRRYWTKGGSLRNVPVGGGCRKNRRSKSAKPRSPPASSADRSRDSNELSEISNCDSNASKRGSEIDLAAVFANFLNHSPAVAEPVGAIGEKVSETDLAQGSAMVGNEIGESEEVGEAVFWSEASESFSWQQMAHLQDVEGFVANSPMNLVNDSVWSSFDFSGFEIFSRSYDLLRI